ncbi:MAG: peptide ABC transporter substrate-binding protein [Bacteroidetes bacterium]|nr:peptide ABC transporter substrate-binding protein [Bacteroidota bacterium]
MKKISLATLFSALILSSCGGDKKQSNNTESTTHAEAKGGRVYGGCLRVAEGETYSGLNPASIIDVSSAFIATQLYDGLVRLNNRTLQVAPAIAEKWEIDPSGTKYTFHLRKGVLFHDNSCFANGKGREVKASDFKYSFEQVCKNSAFLSTFKDRVKGANSYNEGTGNLEGVKDLDDYTLEITLVHPSSVFLNILASPVCGVVPKEAVEKYGKEVKVGAGAFVFNEKSSDKTQTVLTRNPHYYLFDSLGNQLPFLDSVMVYIVPSKDEELSMFKAGKLDIVYSLPSQSVKDMVENGIQDFQNRPPKYVLENMPEMITQYYSFNISRPPFDNPMVRKAFNLAINRKKIVDDVLHGQAYGPAIHGITPSTFPGYDITKIHGYDYSVVEAKKLLAQAGYPNGRAFPTAKIILNSGGARHTNVVVEIQKELLENLNVNVDFEVMPFAKKVELAQSGRADIVRDSWVADYPSPESFLNVFYGANVPKDTAQKSYINTIRYKNKTFDTYFEMGRDAVNKDSSYAHFMKAEQQLMNDAPIMPLWYDGNYRIVQADVQNAHSNQLLYRNLADVYIKAKADTSKTK